MVESIQFDSNDSYLFLVNFDIYLPPKTCGKVMFLVVSVCSQGWGFHATITRDLTMQPPPNPTHCTSDMTPKPWPWPLVAVTGDLFEFIHQYWHLMAEICTVGVQAVHIILESILALFLLQNSYYFIQANQRKANIKIHSWNQYEISVNKCDSQNLVGNTEIIVWHGLGIFA